MLEIMISRKGAAVTTSAKSVLVETLAKDYENSGEGAMAFDFDERTRENQQHRRGSRGGR